MLFILGACGRRADRWERDRRILQQIDEVQVETRPDKLIPIWIVVADEHVYLRSVKPAASGTSGLRPEKRCSWPPAIRDGTCSGEHVDQQQVERVNQALRQKYGQRWPRETQMMLESPTLPTTLRLEPA